MNSIGTGHQLDLHVCEQARLTRDARFDGLFFTAVTSTGIYCRPVCPAPTPKPSNVIYFPTAAAAATAGFRPCLRCRPEAAPGSPVHRAGNELVAGALRLIEEGFLDTASVTALAQRIGVGERHLRRLFEQQLGANPLEVATTRRALFAKKLISETTLPITDISLAAGYGSLRRFNAAFQATYKMAPRDLRRGRNVAETTESELALRLPYRAPYDFSAQLNFLARRAMPSIEKVDDKNYRRVFVLAGEVGEFNVQHLPKEKSVLLRVRHSRPQVLLDVVTRVRRLFDLDADAMAIVNHLARDPLLKSLVQRFPGLRVPGCWDSFEIAVRAVLGQQISVVAARTFAHRLVERFGLPLVMPGRGELNVAFPTPEILAEADLTQIGLPRTRAATIQTLARAVRDGEIDFRVEQTLSHFVESWTALPGIGEWTAHYIAMRALGHPDAFPAADLILRRAAGQSTTLSTRALETLSQSWRPWRAYAVLLLWRGQN